MTSTDLTREDLVSPCWAKIKARLEKRLESLRARNDGDLDERQTQRLRGSIAEVKFLLSTGDPKPVMHHTEFPD